MEYYKAVLPSLVSKVRSQCAFDKEGHVRKMEAKEVDEEAKAKRAKEEAKRAKEKEEVGVARKRSTLRRMG
jgi:hypothetical protein